MGIYVENISWDDGTYTGETSDGKTPHGDGEIVYSNGSVYKGKFKNGCVEPIFGYSLIKWVLPDNSTRIINHELKGSYS
ncbi:MAG: hypothetical protein IKA43_00735, partial [Clostridia bacterium]|nr:hypothetical protein [Clostridia bacterium]